jgi:hypothetical protein
MTGGVERETFRRCSSQMLEQLTVQVGDPRSWALGLDFFKALNLITNSAALVTGLGHVLTIELEAMPVLGVAKQFLREIMKFLTEATKNEEFSIGVWEALGNALERFPTPDQEDFDALVGLLAQDRMIRMDEVVHIRNPYIMNVLFRCFHSDKSFRVLEFVNQLCAKSRANCRLCHQSKFDLCLLDYVHQHRDSADDSIPGILTTVSTIACVVSSPVVVQRYISLLLPIESRFLSENHHLLIAPLTLIFRRARESPSVAISCSHIFTFNTLFPKSGFTFTCWICLDILGGSHILSIINDETPLLTLALNTAGYFVMNEMTLAIQALPLHWFFLALTWIDDSLCLSVEGTTMTVRTKTSAVSGTATVKLGGGPETGGRFGGFTCFPPLSRQQITSIEKAGPRWIPDLRNPIFSFASIAGHLKSDDRTFDDILLRAFKLDVLLPLFAHLDLPLRSGNASQLRSLDVISMLFAALSVSEREQVDFESAHGFHIVSHLLLSASVVHVSYEIYLAFVAILERTVLERSKKSLLRQIILQIELWILCDTRAQTLILQHWATIFQTYDTFFLAILPFRTLLMHLRLFYCYERPDNLHNGEDSGSLRPRDPNLDVGACRRIITDLLIRISQVSFGQHDFALVLDHIITAPENRQRLDLLHFATKLVSTSHKPLQNISNAFELLCCVHSILNQASPEATVAVFALITAVHRHCDITATTLYEHFHICTNRFLQKCKSRPLFEGLVDLMISQNVYELLPSCARLANALGLLSLYQNLKPSELFISSDFWAIPAILSAVKSSPADCELILGFLSQCSIANTIPLFHAVRLGCKLSNVDYEEVLNRFLRILCLNMLNRRTVLPSEVANDIFELIRFHFFVREKHDICGTLTELITGQVAPVRESKSETKELSVPECVFGLRIDTDGNWKDANIAELVLQLVSQYRASSSVKFALLVAAFLVHQKYDYVLSWINQFHLSSAECEEHSDEVCYLLSKVWNIRKPFPVQWNDLDIAVVMNRAFLLIEKVATTVKSDLISGFVDLHNKHRRFLHRAKDRAVTVFMDSTIAERVDEMMTEIPKAIERHRQTIEKNSRLWKRLWSNLIVDNAPWDSSRNTQSRIRARWKRSNVLCSNYCPWLMIRNLHYTDHKEASIARDTGNMSSAEQRLKEYREQRIAEMNAKALPEILDVATVEPEKEEPAPLSSGGPSLALFECELIKVRRTRPAICEVLNGAIRVTLDEHHKVAVIRFDRIVTILMRRKCHHPTGIEIFTVSGRSYFLNFPKSTSLEIIRVLQLNELVPVQKQEFAPYFQSLKYTQQWASGLISNFTYLCCLNIFGGRTFNDASQYPFFPWVIADYESETLDFNNPRTFRDLDQTIDQRSQPTKQASNQQATKRRSKEATKQQTNQQFSSPTHDLFSRTDQAILSRFQLLVPTNLVRQCLLKMKARSAPTNVTQKGIFGANQSFTPRSRQHEESHTEKTFQSQSIGQKPICQTKQSEAQKTFESRRKTYFHERLFFTKTYFHERLFCSN